MDRHLSFDDSIVLMGLLLRVVYGSLIRMHSFLIHADSLRSSDPNSDSTIPSCIEERLTCLIIETLNPWQDY